jgi:phosphoribosylanthranilate isomerase
MFRIKICGITNIDDALVAADAGADAIGLNFFSKSRRFVTPEIARQISAALPATVRKVGVFVNHSADEVANVVDQVGLDGVQLHGDEPPEIVSQLPSGAMIVRASRASIDQLQSLVVYLSACRRIGRTPDAVLIDSAATTDYGGAGHVADWDLITAYRSGFGETPLILAGGLTPENVASAIASVRPSGVDVATGVEFEPGRKNPAQVLQFVSAARAALGGI